MDRWRSDGWEGLPRVAHGHPISCGSSLIYLLFVHFSSLFVVEISDDYACYMNHEWCPVSPYGLGFQKGRMTQK